jgi:hypothetical protein
MAQSAAAEGPGACARRSPNLVIAYFCRGPEIAYFMLFGALEAAMRYSKPGRCRDSYRMSRNS